MEKYNLKSYTNLIENIFSQKNFKYEPFGNCFPKNEERVVRWIEKFYNEFESANSNERITAFFDLSNQYLWYTSNKNGERNDILINMLRLYTNDELIILLKKIYKNKIKDTLRTIMNYVFNECVDRKIEIYKHLSYDEIMYFFRKITKSVSVEFQNSTKANNHYLNIDYLLTHYKNDFLPVIIEYFNTKEVYMPDLTLMIHITSCNTKNCYIARDILSNIRIKKQKIDSEKLYNLISKSFDDINEYNFETLLIFLSNNFEYDDSITFHINGKKTKNNKTLHFLKLISKIAKENLKIKIFKEDTEIEIRNPILNSCLSIEDFYYTLNFNEPIKVINYLNTDVSFFECNKITSLAKKNIENNENFKKEDFKNPMSKLLSLSKNSGCEGDFFKILDLITKEIELNKSLKEESFIIFFEEILKSNLIKNTSLFNEGNRKSLKILFDLYTDKELLFLKEKLIDNDKAISYFYYLIRLIRPEIEINYSINDFFRMENIKYELHLKNNQSINIFNNFHFYNKILSFKENRNDFLEKFNGMLYFPDKISTNLIYEVKEPLFHFLEQVDDNKKINMDKKQFEIFLSSLFFVREIDEYDYFLRYLRKVLNNDFKLNEETYTLNFEKAFYLKDYIKKRDYIINSIEYFFGIKKENINLIAPFKDPDFNLPYYFSLETMLFIADNVNKNDFLNAIIYISEFCELYKDEEGIKLTDEDKKIIEMKFAS